MIKKCLHCNYEGHVYGIPSSNGVSAPYGRDAASYLSGICSTFNSVPDVCDTVVSSAAPSPGFGWETTGTATAASCS